MTLTNFIETTPSAAGDTARVDLGLANHQTSNKTLDLTRLTGAAGASDCQSLTLTVGRPLANELVVRMRRVRSPMSLSPAFQEIVVGSLTALNCAIGNALASSVPMVKVTGPQEAMRESEGCIFSILSALRKL